MIDRSLQFAAVWVSAGTIAGPVDGDVIAVARRDTPATDLHVIDTRAGNVLWGQPFNRVSLWRRVNQLAEQGLTPAYRVAYEAWANCWTSGDPKGLKFDLPSAWNPDYPNE